MVAGRASKKLASRYVNAGLGVLLGALVGSRLVYALVNWGYFRHHPGEVFQVWLGGMSAPGAVLGALFGLLVLWGLRLFPLGALADGLLPLLGTLSLACWLGCWSDGSAYGAASTAWDALPAIDEWGALSARVPVQLLGALLILVLYIGLEQARGSLRQPGLSASLGLLGWALVLFGLSFFRADAAQVWLGLRLEAWGGVGVAAFALVGLVLVMFGNSQKPLE